MRVIDSHVHFPEDKIIDDGLEMTTGGTGYTSGRSVDGPALHPWLDAEKARWEAAWRFPAPVKVSKAEGERLWDLEIQKHDYLKAVVFVTAGSNDFGAQLAKTGRFGPDA